MDLRNRKLIFVATAQDGFLRAWTLIPTTNIAYLNAQRWGRLIDVGE